MNSREFAYRALYWFGAFTVFYMGIVLGLIGVWFFRELRNYYLRRKYLDR